ncbi:hypothetical protein D3C79_1084620 [compost metagenome]
MQRRVPNPYLTAVYRLNASQYVQQRRFSAAGRPGYGNHLAFADFKLYLSQRTRGGFAYAVCF